MNKIPCLPFIMLRKTLLVLLSSIFLAAHASFFLDQLARELPGCRLKGNSILFNSDVNCFNLTLNPGTILQLEGQSAPLHNVTSIGLFHISGVVDKETLFNFPNVTDVDIVYGDISEFAPDSHALEKLSVESTWNYQKITSFQECCKNIKTLNFFNNTKFEFASKGAFKCLSKLNKLQISKQNLTSLTKQFFEGADSLENIFLNSDTLETIDEDTFSVLPDLKSLDIRSDHLKTLGANTFKPLKKLDWLHIQADNLFPLDLDMFDQQKELTNIYMPTNTYKNFDLEKLKNFFPKMSGYGYNLIRITDPEEKKTMEAYMDKLGKILLRW